VIIGAAQRENRVRRAEDGGLEGTGVGSDDHDGAPACGVEGDPASLWPGGRVGSRVDAAPQRQHVQRHLHGVTQRRPPALAEHDASGDRAGRRRRDGGDRGARRACGRVDPAGRVVACAACGCSALGCPDRDRGHLVAGDRAGLVGADHRGGAEGLDRLQPADQRLLSGHGVGRAGQRERDGGQQALGHQGDGHPDGEHQALGEAHPEPERTTEEHGADGQGDDRDDPHDLPESHGQRAGRVVGAPSNGRDAGEPGGSPGGDDDRVGLTLGDEGARADRRPAAGPDGHALPGQHRLVHGASPSTRSRRRSAQMRSPATRSTTSLRTSSAAGTVSRVPSRRTVARTGSGS
jgi:hypothetical protein